MSYKPFKTQAKAIQKILNSLGTHKTSMHGTPIIVPTKDYPRMQKAKEHLREARRLLEGVSR